MGYFPNGCAGEDYEARFCNRCVHQDPEGEGCAVWLAHMLHNYNQANNDASILDELIPRTKDGLGNEKCKMFAASSRLRPPPALSELERLQRYINDHREVREPENA